MSQIIVPLTSSNQKGLDDLLDGIRTIFQENFTVHEAYIIETDNPGLMAFAQALAEKSGVIAEQPAGEIAVAAPAVKVKKTYKRKPKAVQE